jgi:glycosyltransferase involved in cell wall biosynthesis
MLVRVVEKIQRRRPVALFMIGDGPTRSRCEELVTVLGVTDAFFPGAVRHEQMSEYLGVLDIAAVTSKAQSQFHYSPLKLKEYLAAGRAVVAPSLGVVSYLLRDTEDVLMYTPGDESEMVRAIERIIDDPVLKERLQIQGQATYDRLFTIDRQLDLVAQHLNVRG